MGEKLYEGFKELYPGIFIWGDSVFKRAAKNGYIESWGGFRLYLPNFKEFKEAEEIFLSLTKENWQSYREGKEQYVSWKESLEKNKEDNEFPIFTITKIKEVIYYESIKKDISKYFKMKSQYMRLCLNNPCQSAAAWQTKLASIRIFIEIQKNNDFWNVKMLVQIHDSIVLEANSLNLAKKYKEILSKSMKEAAEFITPDERVKFNADAFIGYDLWDGKKEIIYPELQ